MMSLHNEVNALNFLLKNLLCWLAGEGVGVVFLLKFTQPRKDANSKWSHLYTSFLSIKLADLYLLTCD